MNSWPFSGMRIVLIAAVAEQCCVNGKDQGDEMDGIGSINSAGITSNSAMRLSVRETSAGRLEYVLIRVILHPMGNSLSSHRDESWTPYT